MVQVHSIVERAANIAAHAAAAAVEHATEAVYANMSGKTMHDHSLAHDMGHDAHALASTGHDAHADAHGDPHADAHGHGGGHGDGHGDAHGGGHHGPIPISLAFWKLSHVQPYLVVTMFIILTGFAKMIFHKMHWLSSRIPESVLLIIVGAISGAIINTIDACEIQEDCDEIRTFPRFSPALFFYFLLPPIILESAFSLHNKVFMDNLRSIVLYAVFGTICNFLMIGGLLILFHKIEWMGSNTVYKSEFNQRAIEPHHLNFTVPEENEYTSMTDIQILLFASLIAAVDPVAVLAVFSEVGVNPDLYYIVFGESLLNDGVAVVLYNMMNAFAGLESTGVEVTGLHIITGIGSFFTVALGGLFVGFVFGLITAFVTKYTTDIVALEPLAVFSLAYLSYVFADLVNWSGIISLIGCGMLQAHYAFKNISEHGHTCIHVFIKMLAGLCDCIIFIYLGMALFGSHTWHTGFVLWTLALCFITRFVFTFIQTAFINWLRKGIKKINIQEQVIMAYGGLRGAVGFSLVLLIDNTIVPSSGIFVTATLAMVMQTCFFQGSTIKPFVNLLKIDLAKSGDETLSEEINGKIFEHIMAGVEIISGKLGHYVVADKLYHFDQNYMKKWICVPNYEKKMKKSYEKKILSDHLINLYGPAVLVKQNMENIDSIKENGFDNLAYIPENEVLTDTCVSRRSSNRGMSILPGTGNNSWTVLTNTSATSTSANRRQFLPEVDRDNLTSALQIDPMGKIHKVHNRNLTDTGDMDPVEQAIAQREQSARIIMETLMDGGNGNKTFDFHNFRRPTLDENMSSEDVSYLPKGRRASTASVLNFSDLPNRLNGSCRVKPIARHVEGMGWDERNAVEAVLTEHYDLRRRKSLAPGATNASVRNHNDYVEGGEDTKL